MVAAWLAAGIDRPAGPSPAARADLAGAWPWRCGRLAARKTVAWNLGNPGRRRDLGLLLTASALPAVNVLAVAVVLAAIAQIGRGLTARVVLIAALAAAALGLFRFACDSIPSVWLAADRNGWMLAAVGRLAGRLPLEVGSDIRRARLPGAHGGDIRRLAGLYGPAPPSPRPVGRRGHRRRPSRVFGRACLFGKVAGGPARHGRRRRNPTSTTSASGRGATACGCSIPWNMPLLAMVIDGAIAAVMFRRATWLPVIELDPKELKRQKEKEEKEEMPGSVLAADMLFRFGPAVAGRERGAAGRAWD